MPDVLLSDIASRRASAKSNSEDVSTPIVQAKDTAPQAKILVSKARAALKAGRIDEARDLAEKADQLKVAFGLFEDTPEILMADIERASNDSVRKTAQSSSPGSSEGDGLAKQSQAMSC